MSFWARSLRNEALNEIQHDESEEQRDLLRGLIDDAQDEGAIAAGHDREKVLDLLGALIDGISLHALLYPERMPPQRQQRMMEFALELLAGDGKKPAGRARKAPAQKAPAKKAPPKKATVAAKAAPARKAGKTKSPKKGARAR